MNWPERIRVGDRVTIFQRGKKKTWCADFWRDGRHQRLSLKTANKKVAVERATKLAATLVDGSFHRPPPSADIADTIETYLDYLKTENRAPKTIVKYKGILEIFAGFLREQGVTKLARITAVYFDAFRAYRRKDHEVKTLYTEGIVVKQFLRWTKKRKLLSENPLEGIVLKKPRLEPKGGPTLEQVNLILANVTDKLLAMMATLAFTGMRSGDMQRLRREDVDLAGNWINVISRPGAETKSRKSRKVPIHPRLRWVLAACPVSPGPWFFTAEPSPKYPMGDHWINTKKLNDRFTTLLDKLKLPKGRKNGFTIHSFRHFFETLCVNANIPQRVIDAWLGHSADKSMAAVYYSLADKESQTFMSMVPFGTGMPAADAGNN